LEPTPEPKGSYKSSPTQGTLEMASSSRGGYAKPTDLKQVAGLPKEK
jgi:hypothetical protein